MRCYLNSYTDIFQEGKAYSAGQTDQMKEHVDGSLRLIEHIDFPWKVLPAIRHHHERYDGTGYPAGLKAENIPLDARILTIADSYDAMTSERPYRREEMTMETALEELKQGSGTQFDPHIVNVFVKLMAPESAVTLELR